MMLATALRLWVALGLLGTSFCQVVPKEFYVDAQKGGDSNPGTKEEPFKTLIKARDAVRKATGNGKSVPKGGVDVAVLNGNYDLSEGALELNENDSGGGNGSSFQSRIRWFAEGQSVRLLGGKRIPNSEFKAASEVGSNIFKVDLKGMGLTNYGELMSGGLHSCANKKMELFFNNQPMTLARHPNINDDATWQWMQIEEVESGEKSFQFKCQNVTGWKDASTMWLHGYWEFDWADNYVHVSSLNEEQGMCTVTIDPTTPFAYSPKKMARFYALNVLQMLDSPGEYFIDRKEGILYFYPPSPLNSEDAEVYVSVAENIITATGTLNVNFENFHLYYAQGTAVVANNVKRLNIYGGRIANNGVSSVFLSGTNNALEGIEMFGNGCGGVNVTGGDQKMLIPGDNEVGGCEIHDYSRWKRTYMPGIFWSGVGNTFIGNFISDAPHSGILGGGNNCVFERNTLNNLCYETTDAGAFYSGRSWIDRGNVIAFNYFINIRTTEKIYLGYPSVQAIYLDDQMSGYKIYNNTFVDCQCGTFLGGGRRNMVYNNSYEDCDLDVHLDNRGMGWQNESCQQNGMFGKQLQSVNYQEPPWSTRYPELVNIFSDHPCVPVYNNVAGNTYCNIKRLPGNFTDVTQGELQQWMSTFTKNEKLCAN